MNTLWRRALEEKGCVNPFARQLVRLVSGAPYFVIARGITLFIYFWQAVRIHQSWILADHVTCSPSVFVSPSCDDAQKEGRSSPTCIPDLVAGCSLGLVPRLFCFGSSSCCLSSFLFPLAPCYRTMRAWGKLRGAVREGGQMLLSIDHAYSCATVG